MAHGFFGLMKPYGGRRSSATATGMRQNQAGKDMCQMCRRINQRFPKLIYGNGLVIPKNPGQFAILLMPHSIFCMFDAFRDESND